MSTKEMNFENALSRLEQIVRTLEGGNASLDDSLALFEEGVKLVKYCNDKLENAEASVTMLVKGDGQSMVEKDFSLKSEE